MPASLCSSPPGTCPGSSKTRPCRTRLQPLEVPGLAGSPGNLLGGVYEEQSHSARDVSLHRGGVSVGGSSVLIASDFPPLLEVGPPLICQLRLRGIDSEQMCAKLKISTLFQKKHVTARLQASEGLPVWDGEAQPASSFLLARDETSLCQTPYP